MVNVIGIPVSERDLARILIGFIVPGSPLAVGPTLSDSFDSSDKIKSQMKEGSSIFYWSPSFCTFSTNAEEIERELRFEISGGKLAFLTGSFRLLGFVSKHGFPRKLDLVAFLADTLHENLLSFL